MSEESAFLKAIAADPKDDTARLAFADWLQDRDDPRAPWVRDRELWQFMKPDAKDPTATLIARVRRGWSGSHLLTRLGPSVIPHLLEELANATTNKAARRFSYALGALGPSAEVALPALTQALEHENTRVRCGAHLCIGGLVLSNDEALRITLDALESRDRDIQGVALATFTNSRYSFREPAHPRLLVAVPKLRMLALGTDPDAADRAISALQSLYSLDESLLPRLAAMLQDEHRSGLSAYAIRELGVAAVRTILDTARSLTGNCVWRAAEALGGIAQKHPEAVPLLRDALHSPHPGTRQMAANALARVAPGTNADTLPSLIEALCSDDLTRQLQALQGVQRLGPAAAPALPVLIEMLRVASHSWDVYRALELLGPATESAVPELLDIVVRAKWPQSESAANVLNRLGRGPSAVVALLTASQKRDIDQTLNNFAIGSRDDLAGLRDVILREYRDSRRSQSSPALARPGTRTFVKSGSHSLPVHRSGLASWPCGRCGTSARPRRSRDCSVRSRTGTSWCGATPCGHSVALVGISRA